MTNNCGVIKDLLPLYADGICSDESKALVENHISECEDCQKELGIMKRGLDVSSDTDISMFKKINHKIIERIATVIIIAAFIIFGLIFGAFFMLNTETAMDYEKNDLAQNVSVIKSDDGLYLVRNGSAISASYVFMDNMGISNSEYAPYTDENGIKHITYFITLKERISNRFAIKTEATHSKLAVERNLLWDGTFSVVVDAVYYYDSNTDEKYLLWEAE